jgi:hypothetical protein
MTILFYQTLALFDLFHEQENTTNRGEKNAVISQNKLLIREISCLAKLSFSHRKRIVTKLREMVQLNKSGKSKVQIAKVQK